MVTRAYGFSDEAKRQFFAIIDKVPMALQKVKAIFSTPDRKSPGGGGISSIFVSDLCKLKPLSTTIRLPLSGKPMTPGPSVGEHAVTRFGLAACRVIPGTVEERPRPATFPSR